MGTLSTGSEVTIATGDIEIGAVEIKNATDDTRAKVLAASTAAVAGDTALIVALHPTSPLPAGTAAIGKLAANSGVDIGDVDVTSLIVGTGATNLGKAVDAVAGATDTGVAVLAMRDDALGALTPIEGDYANLRVDANGALWTHDDALDAAISGSELQVDVVASLPAGTNAIGKLATNSGVDIGDVDVLSVIPGTGATNLGKAVDTAFGATDTGVLAVAVRDDALATLTPIDNDCVPLRTTSKGALWTADVALNGPGAPVIDSYTSVAINLAAAADQSIIAAPGASKQIWVYGYHLMANVAGTVAFQDEDNVAHTGIMQFGATGGAAIAPSGNFAMPLFKVATNKALELDIVTSEIDGIVQYAVVSV